MDKDYINASTSYERWMNEQLGKHFHLTRQEDRLLSSLLLPHTTDECEALADKCLFNLEETGSRWTEEQLLYLIDLLDGYSQTEALAESTKAKISMFI